MNQNQTCSRCDAPHSPDFSGGLCARCSSTTSTAQTNESNSTTPPSIVAVTSSDQAPLPSTFLDEVLCTMGKTFDILFSKPYVWAGLGLGIYRQWKSNPKVTWGIVGWMAAILFGIVVLYSVIRAAFPRVVAFINVQPALNPRAVSPDPTTSSSSSHGWWLLHSGRPTGPHSLSHLLEAADRGDFALDALVCPVGSQQWSALRTVLPPPVPTDGPSAIPSIPSQLNKPQ